MKTSTSKLGCSLLCLSLLLSLLLPARPILATAPDLELAEVSNYPQVFATLPPPSAAELTLLQKQQFFARLPQADMREQLFYIYDTNDYAEIPSFVTTDAIMHVFHVFFDFFLRSLEQDSLFPASRELHTALLQELQKQEGISKSNPSLAKAYKGVQAYLGVGQELLGGELLPSFELDSELSTLVTSELSKIKAANTTETCALNGFDLDYSQFKPRGHYTRSPELESYFKIMMLYGHVGFPLEKNGAFQAESTQQALLLAVLMGGEQSKAQQLWRKIYDLSSYFAGQSDDLSVADYLPLWRECCAERDLYTALGDPELLHKFYQEAKKLKSPRLQGRFTEQDSPQERQFRLMGQRYTFDADIMQNLMMPLLRPIPQGLDVMAAFGSEAATALALASEANQAWEAYPAALKQLQERMLPELTETWADNLYNSWLWILMAQLNNSNPAYPPALQTEAWTYKDLNSSLASWAQLKHDTVLYGKQPAAQMGGGMPPEKLKGYVEPNLKLYERLLSVLHNLTERLDKSELWPEGQGDVMQERLKYLSELVEFLHKVSRKELAGKPLTAEEHLHIRYMGGRLEGLMAMSAGTSYWALVESATDRNMATIADVATISPNRYSSGGCLEVAVGPALELWVVVPIEGEQVLCRGAIFSYFEFYQEGERLSDEEWQQQLAAGQYPALQEWQGTFISPLPVK